MASAYKQLGQFNPTATTLTDAYTVPGATQTVLAGIQVCNRSATPTSFRISVAPAGAGDAVTQYYYYDFPIQGNDSVTVMGGVGLATTDVVRVYATLATLTFVVTGCEIT